MGGIKDQDNGNQNNSASVSSKSRENEETEERGDDGNEKVERNDDSEKRGKGRQSSESTSKKVLDSKAQEDLERKAAMETKIRQRIQLESRAFDVVNRLIEPNITTEFLLEACRFIDHSHYEDVVEERAISLVCGYPACSNTLKQITRKKYQISTKTNTVYDITHRKKFCSNHCYRASQFLQKQIPETPVWTRRDDSQVKFDLLQKEEKRLPEGDEVIGNALFPLKQELLILEKMDQRAAGRPRVPGNDSQRLSQQLQSVEEDDLPSSSVKEEDLGTRMAELSLKESEQSRTPRQEQRTGAAPATERQHGEGLDVAQGSHQGLAALSVEVEAEGEGQDGGSSVPGLESAMELLKVRDSTSRQRCIDSDDDDDDKDSDDDDTTDSSKLCGVSETDSFSERSQLRSEDSSFLAEADTSGADLASGGDEGRKTEARCDTQQRPGESKSDYLLRLLDSRRHLLSKVADVQGGTSTAVKTPSPPVPVPAALVSERKRESGKARVLQGVAESGEKTVKAGSVSVKKAERRCIQVAALPIAVSEGSSSVTATQEAAGSAGRKPVSPVDSVCLTISSWVTPDTLTYLRLDTNQGQGEAKGQGQSADAFHTDPEVQKRYNSLCQRLSHQERDLDDLLGEEDVGEEKREGGRRPVPDYQELKKQVDEYQTRVQRFMGRPGEAKTKLKKEDGGEGESKRSVTLPAVDSHNQLLIRRRIVLDRLDRTLPDLLPPLDLSLPDVAPLLRQLVFTFQLGSDNILFKPSEWYLVVIILLHMLTRRSECVSAVLESDMRSRSLNLMLSPHGHCVQSVAQLVRHTLSQRQTSICDSSEQ